MFLDIARIYPPSSNPFTQNIVSNTSTSKLKPNHSSLSTSKAVKQDSALSSSKFVVKQDSALNLSKFICDKATFLVSDDLKNVLKKTRYGLHIHSRESRVKNAKTALIDYLRTQSDSDLQDCIKMIDDTTQFSTDFSVGKRSQNYQLIIHPAPKSTKNMRNDAQR